MGPNIKDCCVLRRNLKLTQWMSYEDQGTDCSDRTTQQKNNSPHSCKRRMSKNVRTIYALSHQSVVIYLSSSWRLLQSDLVSWSSGSGVTFCGAQDLFLAGIWRAYRVPGIKAQLSTCKSCTMLPALLQSEPYSDNLY